MPRPRYTITADDYQHAYFYLAPKVRGFTLELRANASHMTAETKFSKAVDQTTADQRAAALNAWCEKYLPAAEWTRLKAGIRKRRERWVHYGDSKTLTVSCTVHDYLVKISDRDGVTYNEILEDVLSRAWRGSRTVGKARASPPARRRK